MIFRVLGSPQFSQKPNNKLENLYGFYTFYLSGMYLFLSVYLRVYDTVSFCLVIVRLSKVDLQVDRSNIYQPHINFSCYHLPIRCQPIFPIWPSLSK